MGFRIFLEKVKEFTRRLMVGVILVWFEILECWRAMWVSESLHPIKERSPDVMDLWRTNGLGTPGKIGWEFSISALLN